MTEIKDFLPLYPTIENTNFYRDILSLKEFTQEKLPLEEKMQQEKGFLFKIQKIIMKFMSVYTPYRGILIFHEMGQGKSCTSIATIENILNNKDYKFNNAIILTPSDNISDNFVQEIVLKCGGDKYMNQEILDARGNEKMRLMRKSVKKRYKFNTYFKFAKKIMESKRTRGKTDEEIYKRLIDEYSNTIIVMDEIHNLRPGKNSTKDEIQTYNEIQKLCTLLKNCKIILLSGTPMKDGAEEISSIMNIILSKDQQLPIKDAFINEFMVLEEDGSYTLKNVDILKEKFKGRISYLRANETNIYRKYVGDLNIGKLKYFKLDTDIMSAEQKEIYNRAIDKDLKQKGIYDNSKQAILFAMKQNDKDIYGSELFSEKYILTQQSKTQKKKKNIFSLSQKFKNKLLGKTTEETLKNIEKYSSKYAKTIRQIIDAKDKCVFVYCDAVKGGGSILFSLLLDLVGFSKANSNETEKKPRYCIFTSETSTALDIIKIKNRFNKEDNVNGEFIKVIIGSDIISEGISFNHIQEEHILTPWWNYSNISQALARGLRTGSHDILIKYLKDKGITTKPIINIYLHASLSDNIETNIDLKRYKESEMKDITIKRMERIIQESAFDCYLTKERNLVTNSENGTRECQYSDCNYICDSGETEYTPEDVINLQLYYSQSELKEIIKIIKSIFRNRFKINFEDISQKCSKYSEFQILTALSLIINENQVLINKYGHKCYLNENKNFYYLVSQSNIDNSEYLEYYNRNINISKNISFDNIVKIFLKNNIPNMLYTLKTTIQSGDKQKSEKSFEHYMKIFPDNIIQELLENVIILKQLDTVDTNKEFTDFFYKHFEKSFIQKIENTIYTNYKNNYRCLNKINNQYIWSDCKDNMIQKTKQTKQTSLDTPYYGLFDIKKNTFKIVDNSSKTDVSDKRKKNTGKVCSTWNIPELLPVIQYINNKDPNAKIPEKGRKNKLCDLIKDWFDKNNLLIQE